MALVVLVIVLSMLLQILLTSVGTAAEVVRLCDGGSRKQAVVH